LRNPVKYNASFLLFSSDKEVGDLAQGDVSSVVDVPPSAKLKFEEDASCGDFAKHASGACSPGADAAGTAWYTEPSCTAFWPRSPPFSSGDFADSSTFIADHSRDPALTARKERRAAADWRGCLHSAATRGDRVCEGVLVIPAVVGNATGLLRQMGVSAIYSSWPQSDSAISADVSFTDVDRVDRFYGFAVSVVAKAAGVWQRVNATVHTTVRLAVSFADFVESGLPPPLYSTRFKDDAAVIRPSAISVTATTAGRGLRTSDPYICLKDEPTLGITSGAWFAAVFACLIVLVGLVEPDFGHRAERFRGRKQFWWKCRVFGIPALVFRQSTLKYLFVLSHYLTYAFFWGLTASINIILRLHYNARWFHFWWFVALRHPFFTVSYFMKWLKQVPSNIYLSGVSWFYGEPIQAEDPAPKTSPPATSAKPRVSKRQRRENAYLRRFGDPSNNVRVDLVVLSNDRVYLNYAVSDPEAPDTKTRDWLHRAQWKCYKRLRRQGNLDSISQAGTEASRSADIQDRRVIDAYTYFKSDLLKNNLGTLQQPVPLSEALAGSSGFVGWLDFHSKHNREISQLNKWSRSELECIAQIISDDNILREGLIPSQGLIPPDNT
jgi:hypothetical protein